MSHTSKLSGQLISEPAVMERAVLALGADWSWVGHQTDRLYDGSQHTGFWFKPAGWRYAVCVRDDGTIAYDNFNGSWGAESQLDLFEARYFAELIGDQATREGQPWSLAETEDEYLVTVGED